VTHQYNGDGTYTFLKVMMIMLITMTRMMVVVMMMDDTKGMGVTHV
jgi:hypothetical protein